MLKNKIGIIIVGYNSEKYLPECLGSIFDSCFKDFKVYFVDNNSTDGSIKYIEKNWKIVEIIRLEENFGFAKANNIGSQKAINDGCEYVFLLNPDTLIEKDCLELLYSSRKSNMILQPLILLHENGEKTDLINTSGNILHFLGISYVGNYRKNYKETILEKDIALASGAAMFIPIGIINKIGLFDEDFFMYHEDVDFCWRSRMAGYNIELIRDALVWHKYSFSRNKLKLYYVERNRLIFLLKNFQLKTLLLYLPISFLAELGLLAYSIVGGWFNYKLKAEFAFLTKVSATFKKRRNSIRKINDRKLDKYLASDLNFSEIQSRLIGVFNGISKFYRGLIRKVL